MNVIGPDGPPDVIGFQPAVLTLQRAGHEATHDRDAPHLIQIDVAPLLHDYLIPPVRVGEDSNGVSLGPTRDEEACFHTQHLSCDGLEFVYCGIVSIYVVTDDSLVGGLPHLRGGPSDGVAPKIEVLLNHI